MQLIFKKAALVAATTLAVVVLAITILKSKMQVEVNGNKELVEKAGLLYLNNSLFTGVTIERFPDRTIYRSIEYLNGLRHGLSEEFGFTGALRHRWNFAKGLKEGIQYGWYLEGPKKYAHSYKKGLLHGLSTEWFIGGSKFRVRNFEKGVEESHKVYYSTSELHTNYVKKDGAIYGLKSGELCMDFPKDGEVR